MAIKRVGYSMPMGGAGIMSAGKTGIGGIKINPKTVLIASIVFIMLILIIGRFM